MSNPSKPVDIASPRQQHRELLDVPGNTPGTPGTPRGRGTPSTPSVPNISPRYRRTSPANPDSSVLLSDDAVSGSLPARTATPLAMSRSASSKDLDKLSEEVMAKVLRRHLVAKGERQNQGDGTSTPASIGEGDGNDLRRNSPLSSRQNLVREDTEPFPMPYDAPGGDVAHPIYKWEANQRRQAARPRATSFAGPSNAEVHPAFEHIHEPGGFRRNYVLLRGNGQGSEEPAPVSTNFIEFLYLFGHFAGEDLEEDEEEDEERIPEEDEERGLLSGTTLDAASTGALTVNGKHVGISERTSLLGRDSTKRSLSRSRRRRSSVGPHGDATVTQAVLMLLKAFVGTGILFLGRAYLNGGMLFSICTLVFIALISLYSFLLLVKTKFVVPGSFGDIGGALYGPWLRYAILTSITVSQLGFVSAYTIFVSENLQAFVMAVTNCLTIVPIQYLILAQLIVFLPLALVRNLAKLSTTALVADVFILAGLVYIFSNEAAIIADRGVAKIEWFNSRDFPLMIGTAVFSFEGIGLVIPITDAMREPHKFPAVLTSVMLFLTVLFGGAGAMSYATFGPEIQSLVITNLNQDSKVLQTIQFLYSIAILLSAPLQLFPAIRIMENGLFTRSGKADPRVKWEKNIFRFAIVMLCSAISWAGAKDLDKFVSFVGSFACVPLCYVYPPMLHYKACARTRRAKIADIALLIFGVAASIYTTVQTIKLMVAPETGGDPTFGSCDISTPPSFL